jgi:hypothetical protein
MRWKLALALLVMGIMATFTAPANAGYPIQVIRTWEQPNSNPTYNFVYLEYEYTKGVEFWNLNEITSITCSPSVGTCTDKGTYTLSWAPSSRFPTIRVADLPNSDPFTVTINITTAPKLDLTNTTTESLTHYYRYNSPVTGHDLTPTLTSSNENPVGNYFSFVFQSQRRYTDTHIYTSAHSCFISGTTCDTSQTFNQDGTYTITLEIRNYTQGQPINVTLNRHWAGQNYINETLTNPSEGTHVSSYSVNTLQPGLIPQIADVKSEIGGCSFRITNYDPNFRFFFKRQDTDVFISNDGFVRISGQEDGTSLEDYPTASRSGHLTKQNLSAIFVCTAFTKAVRIKIEEEARLEAIRIAEAEAARLAEIRRQNAIGDLINIQLNNVIPISTFRDAGVWSVLPETVEQLSKFVFTLDKSSRSDIQLVEKKSKEFRTEYFHSKLEQEISYINLINLEFTNLSERLIPELKIVLDKEKYVKEKDYKSIQKSIDTLNILFQGRDYGTLGESQLVKIGVKISLSNKKSEVLMKFRSQPADVFRDPATVQVAINQIEKVIQDRLDRTIAAKEKTKAILEKIRARSASRGG